MVKKIINKVNDDNERGARQAVIEELFNDYNRSRFTVYKINFVRGIFFGFGSVLGGTLVVAAIAGLLSLIGHLLPGVIADFINAVVDAMHKK